MIDDDLRPWLQVGDFPPTKSASLHKQRVQFLRVKRGERPEKTSQFLGVSRTSRTPSRWRAVITNKERGLEGVILGTFDNEEQAARAYDIVSLASYGQEGTTNFPKEDYGGIVGSKWAAEVVKLFADGDPPNMETAKEALALASLHVTRRTRPKGA